MRITQEAIDLLKASAASRLRDRWFVVDRETGVIIERSAFTRPRALKPEHVVVPV